MNTLPRTPDDEYRRGNRQGSALVIVMGMVAVMGLLGAVMATVTGQSAFRVRKTLRACRALSTAEAGVADVLDIMNTNFAAGIGVSYQEDFGDGSYAVV